MADKRSVYLSAQALRLVRPLDSLSGRLNQVCDRYAELIRQHGPPIRASFTAAQWGALLDACAAWCADPERSPDDLRRIVSRPDWSAADWCALAELIEADA
jgi:hypothetical protein